MKTTRDLFPSALRGVLILAIAMSLATAAVAQPGPFGKGGRGGGDRLASYLELDESQQAEWQALGEAFRDSVQPLFEEIRANGQALREALDAGSSDATAIGELVLAGHDLKQQVSASREQFEADRLAVLTSEQQEKYEAFKAARGERGPRSRSRGRGRRGGGPFGR